MPSTSEMCREFCHEGREETAFKLRKEPHSIHNREYAGSSVHRLRQNKYCPANAIQVFDIPFL
jgi:hypothetical protein